jgi:hypothetical protein
MTTKEKSNSALTIHEWANIHNIASPHFRTSSLRRSIDGTEAQIFRLLTKLLRTFEPTVLAEALFDRSKMYGEAG